MYTCMNKYKHKMQNSINFFLFSHSSWVSPDWFFFTKHYPVILPLLIVSLTLKVLCYSPAVSSTEEHISETQVLQISMGHGYLAPSRDLFPCWKPMAMAPSLCSAICHPKAPWGHCLLRYRDLSWSFQLLPDSFELIIAKGNYTFW